MMFRKWLSFTYPVSALQWPVGRVTITTGSFLGFYFGIENIEPVNGMMDFSHNLVCEEKSSGMLCS